MTVVSLSKRTGKTRVQEIIILARKSASERNFSRAFPDRSGGERTAAENPSAEGASRPGGCAAAVHHFTVLDFGRSPRRPS